jgi:hypothetical protein
MSPPNSSSRLTAHGDRMRVEVAARNAVFLVEDGAILVRIEQAERRLVHRRTLDRVERHLLHQRLQALGDRTLAAADRAEQVEDLLLFLEPLRRVAEVAHHLLDGVFQP